MKSSIIFSCRSMVSGFVQKSPVSVGIKHHTRGINSNVHYGSSVGLEQKHQQPQEIAVARLPVPPLNETLSKYLRSVKPLLTNEEFERTSKIVIDFGSEGGLGPKLQQLLEQRASETENWLAEWWLNSAYLEYRWPVVVYSSPGLVFPLERFKSKEEQLSYAAKLIYGALCYKQSIDKNTMAPDMMGKVPLDMSQYKKVFGTNRNPGLVRDELSYHHNTKYIVVVYKTYFYKVPVYNPKGDILNPTQIFNQLEYVVEQTTGLQGIPVGILTSANRNTWGQVYKKLAKSPVNQASLKIIEESLFVVSIDRHNRPLSFPKPGVDAAGIEDAALSERQTVAALQMIHGNRTNSGNRWFDKTIQFIVGAEGEVGLTYEHSPAEGPPIANLMDYIVNNIPKYAPLLKIDHTPTTVEHVPEQIPFDLKHKKTMKAIAEAKEHLDVLIDDLDMACFTFQKYGKDFIKSCKLSPDSYIQMAIQAAFFKIHGIPGAHYESASTRMFADGRTETIRSCSQESLDFSKALLDKSLSPQEKFKYMKKAIDGHKNYAANAVRGLGVDRHLLGLKTVALKNGMDVPPLFLDAGYVQSTHFRLSTSQVPSVNQAFMCYGPLVPDGYGCCYNPRNNEMSFGISAFNSSPETHADQFKIALQQTLLDMQFIALQNTPAKL